MKRIWVARILIGLVFFFNLQCAIVFLWSPGAYVSSFELGGAAGEGMIRGLGLLFLMWNVPYAVALWNPVAHRVSLYEAVVMQALGVLGETAILMSFPGGHAAIQASVSRFILFDGFGLAALLVAAWLTWPEKTG
jgi:hypothetical protein